MQVTDIDARSSLHEAKLTPDAFIRIVDHQCDEDRHVFEVEELAASDVAPVNLENYDSALQIRPHGSVE